MSLQLLCSQEAASIVTDLRSSRMLCSVDDSYLPTFGTAYPLKVWPIGCPWTSVNNYQFTLRDIPEERRSRLHCAGSLKSHAVIELQGRHPSNYETDFQISPPTLSNTCLLHEPEEIRVWNQHFVKDNQRFATFEVNYLVTEIYNLNFEGCRPVCVPHVKRK